MSTDPVKTALANLLGVDESKVVDAFTSSKSDSAYTFDVHDPKIAEQLAQTIDEAFKATLFKSDVKNPGIDVSTDQNGKVIFKFEQSFDPIGVTGSTKTILEFLKEAQSRYGDDLSRAATMNEKIGNLLAKKESLASYLVGVSGYNFNLNGMAPTSAEISQIFKEGDFSQIPEQIKQAALKNADELLNKMSKDRKSPSDFKELAIIAQLDGKGELSREELASALISFSMRTNRDNLTGQVHDRISNQVSFEGLMDRNTQLDVVRAGEILRDAFHSNSSIQDGSYVKNVPQSKDFGGKGFAR